MIATLLGLAAMLPSVRAGANTRFSVWLVSIKPTAAIPF